MSGSSGSARPAPTRAAPRSGDHPLARTPAAAVPLDRATSSPVAGDGRALVRAAPIRRPRPGPAGDGVPAAGRRGSAGVSRPRHRPHRRRHRPDGPDAGPRALPGRPAPDSGRTGPARRCPRPSSPRATRPPRSAPPGTVVHGAAPGRRAPAGSAGLLRRPPRRRCVGCASWPPPSAPPCSRPWSRSSSGTRSSPSPRRTTW